MINDKDAKQFLEAAEYFLFLDLKAHPLWKEIEKQLSVVTDLFDTAYRKDGRKATCFSQLSGLYSAARALAYKVDDLLDDLRAHYYVFGQLTEMLTEKPQGAEEEPDESKSE